MEIIVSKHALSRYRDRLFDYTSSEDDIYNILANIVKKGKQVGLRLSTKRIYIEMKHKGVSIVVTKGKKEIVVVTCLGEDVYRRWAKHQSPNVIAGRFKHPTSLY